MCDVLWYFYFSSTLFHLFKKKNTGQDSGKIISSSVLVAMYFMKWGLQVVYNKLVCLGLNFTPGPLNQGPSQQVLQVNPVARSTGNSQVWF